MASQERDHRATDWPLPRTAEPEDVGLSSERLDKLRVALEREVADERIPGAVLAIARHGQLAHTLAVGKRDPSSGAAMPENAMFSIASMTKPIVSVAILQLAEEGHLLLGDPVSKYLPELGKLRVAVDGGKSTRAPAREPTVQDLLRHTSGLTYQDRGTSEAHKRYPGSSITASVKHSKSDFLEALAASPLVYEPGTAWEYGFSTDVLGLIVEAVTGDTLGDRLKHGVFDPLGMTDTAFVLSEANRERYALTLQTDPVTGEPNRPVHHATQDRMQWESGGGGLVSSVADYVRFAEMLLEGGSLDGSRVLGRKSVEMMASDHLGPAIENRIQTMDPACIGYGFGLGVAVRMEPGVAASYGSAGDFYWSGVYGTYFWVDPEEELVCVFMAAAPGAIRLRYRQLTRALVLQALED